MESNQGESNQGEAITPFPLAGLADWIDRAPLDSITARHLAAARRQRFSRPQCGSIRDVPEVQG